jgi:hypothetical protein
MVMMIWGLGYYGIIFMKICIVITVAMAMLLRGFGYYGFIYMKVCIVITIAMAMLLGFGPYETIFMTMYVYYIRFSRRF